MAVAETSLEAYVSDVKPRMGENQAKVYAVIRATGPVCNQEISEILGWPINSVTGRVRELVLMGAVKEAFKAVWEKSGRRVVHWRAV